MKSAQRELSCAEWLSAEIARLRADNERLRAALKEIAAEDKIYLGHGDYTTEPRWDANQAQDIAQKALCGS